MREYQERYIENLKRIMELADVSERVPEDVALFVEQRRRKNLEINSLISENTGLLRQNLMPLLDDIVSATQEDAAQLEDFAEHLMQGVQQLDLLLNYTLRNALLAYARKHEKRDMLIRQLYHTGMALFYMQEIIGHAERYDYRWKMSMLFGEAASYIKKYDEIEDVDTRGYIHRSMANLALAYGWTEPEDIRRKNRAIKRSFQILTDERYHEKTPSLPWDVYLYKSHQERTTAMQLLRRGETDPEVVRDVMESAEYVWKRQLENSEKKGTRPSERWMLEYDIAQYHCGVLNLSQLLKSMEKAYLDREKDDFSERGLWSHIYLPAFYAEYMAREAPMVGKKKRVLLYMYSETIKYVQRVPNGQLNSRLTTFLLESFKSFVEYPDGLQAKDFLLDLVVCRDPDIYVYLRLTADFSRMILEEAIRRTPEQLVGALGCRDADQVRERSDELLRFTYECAMLHDIGTFLFERLVTLAARDRFQEEEKMYRYHVYAGQIILSRFASTQKYMPTALGHHRWYDGSGGYPEEYVREEDPNRQVTDIVAIAAYFTGLMDSKFNDGRKELSVDEALSNVRAQAGTRFSPVFAELFAGMQKELEAYMETNVVRAYADAFDQLRQP